MSRAKQSRHADGEEKRPARRPSRTSLDRKIREQEKELSTLNESRRRRRASAKDVFNAIGFDAMYKDGICQVEEGLFSQTIAFEDISYQSAREYNQQAIFSAYCQLFDYFGAESCVQLSVVNTPIPASEIGRRRFFPAGDADTEEYAREYNRILNDKMREGVSNLAAALPHLRHRGPRTSTRRRPNSHACARTPYRPLTR
ncbi:MAG: hypothetical protein E6Y86_05480 [Slackia sp.]|uniref:hypothetical protein n=1 Tax=uncultured Slackia sp. TaxID=665903 RepID=UPI002804F2E4|nr:hypothetical protein [uncultured Slackia sp.]MDU6011479.1 hypothetical protein [Slackia sp.]